MAAPLRSIAVTVDEGAHGAYSWSLLERVGDAWIAFDTASTPTKSYATAMASGLLALQALMDDVDVGPREEGAARDTRAVRSPEAPVRPFGFGTLK